MCVHACSGPNISLMFNRAGTIRTVDGGDMRQRRTRTTTALRIFINQSQSEHIHYTQTQAKRHGPQWPAHPTFHHHHDCKRCKTSNAKWILHSIAKIYIDFCFIAQDTEHYILWWFYDGRWHVWLLMVVCRYRWTAAAFYDLRKLLR